MEAFVSISYLGFSNRLSGPTSNVPHGKRLVRHPRFRSLNETVPNPLTLYTGQFARTSSCRQEYSCCSGTPSTPPRKDKNGCIAKVPKTSGRGPWYDVLSCNELSYHEWCKIGWLPIPTLTWGHNYVTISSHGTNTKELVWSPNSESPTIQSQALTGTRKTIRPLTWMTCPVTNPTP